ncbi:hypothetical protein [Paracidovorax avenae]|uniref:hypothetical protein n=1 Tax=Paracidovorax avenae TaxID=80867 RepID=UPI000FE1BA44|nr:hypothetical protein [Paracidovorax avenae]
MVTAKEFFRALDNVRPLDTSEYHDSRLYVPRLHGDTDAIDLLQAEIDFQTGEGVYLFTGLSGTGKSTELLRLKAKLEEDRETRYKVFYTDLEDWLNLQQPVELGSFLLALVASWIENTGSLEGQRSPARRLQEFLKKTKVDLTNIDFTVDFGAVKAQLKTALSYDPTVVAQVEKAIHENKTNFIQQVHDLIATLAKDLIGPPSNTEAKVVLLVDSLEKIWSAGPKADDVYASVLTLFQNDYALKLPLVHVVYSISFLVLEQNRQLATRFGNTKPVSLPSVHVFQHHSDQLDPAGVARMKELLTKRFAEWGQFFTDAQIEEIVRKTGGDLRDFLRALRSALLTDRNKSSLRISDAAVQAALNDLSPSLTIPSEHVEWLIRVDNSHQAELGESITASVLDRYLASKHVLAYRNGGTWYALHPLIRDEIKAMHQRIKERQALAKRAQH